MSIENQSTLKIKKYRNENENKKLHITLQGIKKSISHSRKNDEENTKDICLGEMNVNKPNNQHQQEDRRFYISIRKNLSGFSGRYYKDKPIKNCRLESYNLNYKELVQLKDCINELLTNIPINKIIQTETKNDYNLKLQEYRSLLSLTHGYKDKDYKNNYKFISSSVMNMIKQKVDSIEIYNFVQDAIDIHKRNNQI